MDSCEPEAAKNEGFHFAIQVIYCIFAMQMQRYCKPSGIQNKTSFIFIPEVPRSLCKDTANRVEYKIKQVLFLFPRCRVAYVKILQTEWNTK